MYRCASKCSHSSIISFAKYIIFCYSTRNQSIVESKEMMPGFSLKDLILYTIINDLILYPKVSIFVFSVNNLITYPVNMYDLFVRLGLEC